jgi:pseudaminic acid biosynthesis-associated methylase
MSDTVEFWKGEFGDSYTERNRVDWKLRIPFWESAVQFCQPATVLEVGANAGWNLRAIQQCSPGTELFGVDVNAKAVEESRQAGFEVQHTDARGILGYHDPGSIDLVFTAGVLIHVEPQELASVMSTIIAVSGRYVIAIEYDSEETEEVEYRGHKGKLWKRPYGKLYEALGLKLLSYGDAGGFDACTYYLLEKGGAE